MKITLLQGSPHKQSPSNILAEQFRAGAQSAGHEVIPFDTAQAQISPCRTCEYCHTKGGGNCLQKDDMERLKELILSSEMLVIATPLYFFNMSVQTKTAIDRMYAFWEQMACPTCSPSRMCRTGTYSWMSWRRWRSRNPGVFGIQPISQKIQITRFWSDTSILFSKNKSLTTTRQSGGRNLRANSMWRTSSCVSTPASIPATTRPSAAALTGTSGRTVCWTGTSRALRTSWLPA